MNEQRSASSGAAGPNMVAVMALVARIREWKKEQALLRKQAAALEMRRKSNGKRLAVSDQEKAGQA